MTLTPCQALRRVYSLITVVTAIPTKLKREVETPLAIVSLPGNELTETLYCDNGRQSAEMIGNDWKIRIFCLQISREDNLQRRLLRHNVVPSDWTELKRDCPGGMAAHANWLPRCRTGGLP